MALQLEVYSARTYFDGPKEEVERLVDCLRLRDKNSYWKSRGLLKRFGYLSEEKREQIIENAKWINFYDKRTSSFGTGLLTRVKLHLDNVGIKYEVEDERKKLPKFKNLPDKFMFKDRVETRPEQVKVLKDALKIGSGILHCSPNFGKTEVACAIIDFYRRATGKLPRTLFMIHRMGLVEQTSKRFRKHLGIKVSEIGGGKKKPGIITVATTQTAANLVKNRDYAFKDFLSKCDLAILDEIHLNKMSQAQKVMYNCSARMRFGLSGTVSKEPRKRLAFMSLTGPIIAEVRNKELIELGRSAMPMIRLVEVKTDIVLGKYAESYRNGIVYNPYRNRKILKETIRHVNKGRRTLITVGRIKHGIILKDMLKGLDISCEFIRGNTPLWARKKAKERFVNRKISVLVASPIFDVGEDLPEIDAWCNGAGGKGWELVLQRIGRAMRKKKGEVNKVYVTDFVDRHNKYLFKHSCYRMKYYNEEGFNIQLIEEKL